MQAWENFIADQEKVIGKETSDKWLRTLKVIDFDACNLYLEAKDSFQILWFEEHIRAKVRSELLNNNHHPIKVHISLGQTERETQKKEKVKKSESFAKFPFQFSQDPLEKWATLDLFIPGQANLLLFRFLQSLILETAISRLIGPEQPEGPLTPSSSFNPLFIYGGSGLAKTHLLMGIAHHLREKGKNALFVGAETFTEHVVNAIRSGEMQAFRKAYRHVDALIVDDVHVFSRKSATQEEFFHTFNALHTSGKQIILSSHLAPQQLEDIEPRLISRFEWGLSLHLEKLSQEELKQVLRQRCKIMDFPLQESVFSFLLEHFGNNQKNMLRALDALILREHLNALKKKPTTVLDLSTAQEHLAKLLEEEKKRAITPDRIIASVANFYGIRSEDILGKSQTQECSLPRQLAMYLCRTELKLPFIKIGQIFSRDHSTVMTGVKQIQKSAKEHHQEIAGALSEIQRRLEENANI